MEKESTYKKPKKGWAIFMVIVILMIVASGGFYFVWNKNQITKIKKENEDKIQELKKIVESEKQKREEADKEIKENLDESIKGVEVAVPEAEKVCEIDSDCVPNPAECHPRICLNKKYEEKYKSKEPMACTMMIDTEAAYQPENCGCQKQNCVNLNLEKK